MYPLIYHPLALSIDLIIERPARNFATCILMNARETRRILHFFLLRIVRPLAFSRHEIQLSGATRRPFPSDAFVISSIDHT